MQPGSRRNGGASSVDIATSTQRSPNQGVRPFHVPVEISKLG